MTRLLALAFLLLPASRAQGLSIVNSKHDLSATSASPGPKASSEGQVCIFCHSAHRPGLNVPLWNHALSTQAFTFYSSNYVNNYLGMAVPTMAQLTGSRSRLCLSCHDGVTALGGVFNLGEGRGGTISVTGTLSASSNIGTDLRLSHPVLYDVKPGAGPPTAPGTDPEIQLPPSASAVRVYGPTHRVECTSCHDAHNDQYGSFLVASNANAALCTACHVKTGYSSSVHATSPVSYSPSGGAATTVAEWSCRNCHTAHGASGAQAYNLAGAEEATCYACHGNTPLPGAQNLQSVLSRSHAHPTNTVSGKHKDPEMDGSNFTFAPVNNRHAECQDCHNPHQAKSGAHTAPTNVISNVLLGQWGAEPRYGATPWVPPVSYATERFSDTSSFKEYQLCLKCHSSFAFGTSPAPGYTDQGIELNVNNRSAHPVLGSLTAQTGSVAPQVLLASQLSAPWNASPGGQTMYCGDCHGSDQPGDPQGPHGSNIPFMLGGPAKYWPQSASGALWTLNDVENNQNGWSTDLFCVNCHPLKSNGVWNNNAHGKHKAAVFSDGGGARCVMCHVAVPHGAKRSRLIGYADETTPYNYGGSGLNALQVSGFSKAAGPNGYTAPSCFSAATECHVHSTNAGGYDP